MKKDFTKQALKLGKKNLSYTLLFFILLLLPIFLSDFRLALIGKFLTFAIIAVGLDLLWGYTGILSLGHGVFFSLGAYSMAMYLKLQSEKLPDFMSWSGLESLPWFWQPFQYLWFALPMAIIIPMIFAVIIGYSTFRSGIKGVYFTILTQALALAISILFIGQQPFTGGTNGITNLQTIAGFSLYNSGTKIVLYFLSLLCLIVVFSFSKWLVQSKTGRILIAIRDGENRLKFLGYNPIWFKVVIFAFSAGVAGLAGALFVPQVGIISPSSMGILPSVEMAIWVAVGGRGTLFGAILGALGVNLAKTFFSESLPNIWWYFFGALFIGVVLFFPRGIFGFFESIKNFIKNKMIQREQKIIG